MHLGKEEKDNLGVKAGTIPGAPETNYVSMNCSGTQFFLKKEPSQLRDL